MAKRPERMRKAKATQYDVDPIDSPKTHYTTRRKKAEPLEAKTQAQGHYLCALDSSELVFAIGPAGTGKTYCAAAYAADMLQKGEIERIIITRPNIEVGSGMGFLPGELEEKYSPYLEPFRAIMIERMGPSQYEFALKAKTILPKPLGFMRGETFDNAFVILDEAQNTSTAEMKMFLTRIGKHCTVVVDGDPDQCDLPGPSGLMDAVHRLEGLPGVSIVEFCEDDIVRSGLVKLILCAYRK